MHAPTRELLRQDVAALDVPTVPRPGLNEISPETGPNDLASGFYVEPRQGRLHPTIEQARAIGTAWDEEATPDAY